MMPLKAIGSSLLPFVGKELSTTFSFDLSATMPRHLSESEPGQNKLLTMLKHRKAPSEMLATLRHSRERAGESGLSQSAIYTFRAGSTYDLSASKTRGRAAKMTHSWSAKCVGQLASPFDLAI